MEIFPNTCRSTKIIVNADDGFYSDIRDQGIVSCLSAAGYGASDVSILVNGAVARHLLCVSEQKRAQSSSLFSFVAKNNFIPGLHFNLTEGKSLTNEKSIHSLLDHRGCFLGKFGFRKHLMSSAINMTEVELELESQLNAFRELFGTMPSHFDGHQHIHVLPGIDAIVAKVLSRNGINWIRVPVERVPEESSQLNEAEINFYKEVSDQATEAKKTFTSYNLKFTQGFIGMTIMGKNQTIQSLDQCLSSLENYESIEFMVHPGFKISHSSDLDTAGCGNPEGPDLFSQSNDREHEMAFLTSDEFRKYLLAHSYELVAFSNIS